MELEWAFWFLAHCLENQDLAELGGWTGGNR